MKKVIFVFSVLFILVFVYIIKGPAGQTPLELVEGYEEEWGIKLAEPKKFEQIWQSKHPSHGDGEWYNTLIYEDFISTEESGMSVVNGENIEQVREYVADFVSRTQNAYSGDEKKEVDAIFKNNPIHIEIGDFYFHQSINNDFDTFAALYDKEEKKVHTLVWHQ